MNPPPPTAPLPALPASDIAKADAVALAVGTLPQVTLHGLANRLSGNGTPTETTDEGMLARIVFRWIAENIAYDFHALRVRKMPEPDPDAVLRTRLTVCEGYAALFTALCLELKVEAITVHGHTNDEEHIGKSWDVNDAGHAWNAVKLGGNWGLIEVTWAAGHDAKGQFKRAFQPAWFLMPPARMIRTHLPENSNWQLLAQPMSEGAFQRQAYLKPGFFDLVENFQVADEGTLPANDPLLTLESIPSAEFAAELLQAGKPNQDVTVQTRSIASPPKTLHDFRVPSSYTGEGLLRIFGASRGASANRSLPQIVTFRVKSPTGVSSIPSSTADASPPRYSSFYQQRQTQLLEPMQGRLASGVMQKFRIKVSGALNVRLWIGQGAPYFFHQAGADIYEATVPVPQGPFEILAKFDSNSNKLEPLVSYVGT